MNSKFVLLLVLSVSCFWKITSAAQITPDVLVLPNLSKVCKASPPAPFANLGTITGTSNVSFPIETLGVTVVTWTYDDNNGNTLTQNQNVEILADNLDPLIRCPYNIFVNNDVGTCGAVVNFDINAADNCEVQSIVFSEVFTQFQASPHCDSWNAFRAQLTDDLFYTKAILKGSLDEVGLTISDPQQVLNLANALRDGTIGGASGDNGSLWQVGFCGNDYVNGGQAVGLSVNASNGPCGCYSFSPQYIIRPCVENGVINNASDDWGGINSFVCNGLSQTMTVIFEYIDPNINSTTVVSNPPSGSVFPIGTSIVTSTATDILGNSDTCTFEITVTDNEAPIPAVANLPDVIVDCELTSLTPPTATDNCTGSLIATSDAILPIRGQGSTTIITWAYDDGNGNTSTQSQNVIINDITAPTITCSADINVNANAGECSAFVTVPPAYGADNCFKTYALDFDNVDDYVALDLFESGANSLPQMTAEAWVNIQGESAYDGFNANSSLLENVGILDFDRSEFFNLIITQNKEIVFSTAAFGVHDLISSEIPIQVEEIGFHIAAVYDGTDSIIYLNGVEFARAVNPHGGLALGRNGFTRYGFIGDGSEATVFNGTRNNFYHSGRIDEVRYWRTARTGAQIQENYRNIIDASQPGLIAYYDFEDGPGSSILTDLAGGDNNGTLFNMDTNSSWFPVGVGYVFAEVTTYNDFTGTTDASGVYPVGDTLITWTGADAQGNIGSCTQTVTVNVTNPEQITWNGSVSSDWENSSNWTPNTIPSECSEITIPITTNTPTFVGIKTISDLNISSGSSLVIPFGTTLNVTGDVSMFSVSNTYSGLIVNGTLSVGGEAKYHRFTNAQSNGNDLIAPPLSGQSWSSFLTSDTNYNEGLIFNNGMQPNTTYLFGHYEKGDTDDYVLYDDNSSEVLISGRGYRAATNTGNGEALIFTGTIDTGVVNRTITNEITGHEAEWNLIGNPYPAYLDVISFFNHVGSVSGVSNISLLDAPTAAIYGYNANTENQGNIWTILNLATGATQLAPGQGFFVSSGAPTASIEFTPNMQVLGNTDDFILGRSSTPIQYVHLQMQSAIKSVQTSIYFNSNASLGFDLGYDAEVFGSNVTEFSIYSHLIEENNEQPIALQTLHSTDLSEVSIPLGVEAHLGEQLTFSISDSFLPENVNVYLEDMLTNTSILLNTSDYVISPTSNLSGTGRLFLRFTTNALSVVEPDFSALNMYSNQSDKTIVIEGTLPSGTTAIVYDLLGRQVMQQGLDASSNKQILDANRLSSGVYIVELQNANQNKSQKVILK